MEENQWRALGEEELFGGMSYSVCAWTFRKWVLFLLLYM